jgi:predicted AAA+ superfamily ATPase
MPIFPRDLRQFLREAARAYPVVTLTGPRQSGKTTLCVDTFPEHPRVSLEPLDQREQAQTDPRGFLEEHAAGVIIDEVQHAPDLLGYLQEEVDRNPTPGRFVLTGSEHLSISGSVAQSLAGRSAVLHLLPLSRKEALSFPVKVEGLWETLYVGGYPRLHNDTVSRMGPRRWLADYVTNYVQRDVRQLLNVARLDEFSTFLKLCAAQSGNELNLSRLGADAGVSHNTARSWLSVLQASFLCFTLPAWTPNLRKQLVKAPKLHFFDSGLLCHLLGVRSAEELRHHPLRGAVFESWVASELYKRHVHRGEQPDLKHFRQSRGSEIDLLEFTSQGLNAYEVKSGQTLNAEFTTRLQVALEGVKGALRPRQKSRGVLVYGGETPSRRHAIDVVPWSALGDELDGTNDRDNDNDWDNHQT